MPTWLTCLRCLTQAGMVSNQEDSSSAYLAYSCLHFQLCLPGLQLPPLPALLTWPTVASTSSSAYLAYSCLHFQQLALVDEVLSLHKLQLLLQVGQHLHRAGDLLAQLQQLLRHSQTHRLIIYVPICAATGNAWCPGVRPTLSCNVASKMVIKK